MAAVTNLQQNTMYFEQAMRQQLETQESESRFDLQAREAEMREVKTSKSIDSKIVEELRPLCEELPPDALDPVTMEPLNRSIVYRCGHSINISTVVQIAKKKNLCQEDLIKCPSCNSSTKISMLYPYIPIEGCIESFEKISKVFAKNVRTT